MKAIYTLPISLIIILMMVFIPASLAKNDPVPVSGNDNHGITYVVEVNVAFYFEGCNTYYVMIADQNGDPVDQLIMLQERIVSYIFHEQGNVTGMRSAKLYEVREQENCDLSLYAADDVLQDKFRNGSTYVFQLNPTLLQGNK